MPFLWQITFRQPHDELVQKLTKEQELVLTDTWC